MNRTGNGVSFNLEALPRFSERRSLGDRVLKSLRQAIVRGAIGPGDRMVENRIAEAMGISRTPVREALHKLEQEGLLERLPRGGFVVLGLSRKDIEETFGIRGVLESYAARLSALKYQRDELVPLHEKAAEYERFLNGRDLDALTRINTQFHDLLYALSRSPRLIRMINELRDQIFRFRQIILSNAALARVSHEDHKRMLERIEKRDADGVERLVKDHIMRGCAAVLQAYDDDQSSFNPSPGRLLEERLRAGGEKRQGKGQ